MSSNSIFCRTVHVKRADLYFKGLSCGTYQGGVQRLIHVWLWHGDVIFESPRNRLIHLMNYAQHRIAVSDRIYNYANGEQIINLIKSLILIYHFFVDAKEMLCAPVNESLDACAFYMIFYFLHQLGDIFFPDAFSYGDFIHQVIVCFWL